MSRGLPFTKASITRRILGIREAGLFVIAVKPDGTVIVAEQPLDPASIVPENGQLSTVDDLDRELADFEARHRGDV
jgi:hypothetical protein